MEEKKAGRKSGKKKSKQERKKKDASNWDKKKDASKLNDKKSKENARSLQEFTDFSFFEADTSVLVRDTDSMFTAFDGAPGTTLATENSHLRAANLSICFP